MKKTFEFKHFFFLFILLISSNVFGDLIGFENSSCERIQMAVQVHSLILDGTEVATMYPLEDSPISRDRNHWSMYFIDISKERISEHLIESKEKPERFSSPDIIRTLSNNVFTQIDHKRKQVYITQLSRSETSNYFIIFAGKVYQGHSLPQLTQEFLTKENPEPNEEELRPLTIGVTHFSEPITFFLNSKNQIIKQVIKNPRQGTTFTSTFDWLTVQTIGFDYVSHYTNLVEGGRLTIQEEFWIKEVDIDVEFPEQIFQVTYPNEYKVNDMRSNSQLLNPPRIGK